MAEGDKEKAAAAKSDEALEETKPKRSTTTSARQVKATQRLENQGFFGDGSPKEPYSGSGVPQLSDSWVVEKDEFVPADHPAVVLHPTYFEGV